MRPRKIFIFSISVLLGGACLWLLFFWLIHCTFNHNPKDDLARYTGISLTTSSIDRFAVTNTFIDGTDLSYELTLSSEDKMRLINLFTKKGGGCTSNDSAIELVPSTWFSGYHPEVKSYYIPSENTNTDVGLFLDVDLKNDKAWLFIENY